MTVLSTAGGDVSAEVDVGGGVARAGGGVGRGGVPAGGAGGADTAGSTGNVGATGAGTITRAGGVGATNAGTPVGVATSALAAHAPENTATISSTLRTVLIAATVP